MTTLSAVTEKSSAAAARFNLAVVLSRKGMPAEALQELQEALALQPEWEEAIVLCGDICAALGRTDEAVSWYQRGIAIAPASPIPYLRLGNLWQDQGNHQQASLVYRDGLAANPLQERLLNNLGTACKELGRLEEAESCFSRAIAVQPDYVEALNNLGELRREQERYGEAVELFTRALHKRPEAAVYNNLGATLQALCRYDEARRSYEKALAIDADSVAILNNMAGLLLELDNLDAAVEFLQRSELLQPDYYLTHFNMGMVRHRQNDPEAAVAHFLRALELNPHHYQSFLNLGNALKDLGRIEEALGCYRQAMAVRPDSAAAHSNLLYVMHDNARISREVMFAEHLHWSQKFEKPLTVHFSNSREVDRPLRIGYVSPDFRVHSVAHFIAPVLENHDRRQVHVFCYADVPRPDGMTAQFQAAVENWRPIAGLSDDEVLRQIRRDCIDILVDLAGHTGHNRLPLFARKAAPVQVTWLGYPDTTGLSAMDYRITDAVADPPGESDRFHTERLVRLPGSFLCYRPPQDAPLPAAPPLLERGFVTYASFNNFAKVTPMMLELWGDILSAVPASRLLLRGIGLTSGEVRSRIADILAGRGVDAGRVDFVPGRLAPSEHLGLYNSIDIALDSFPYHGTTTTCETLWMGVPVVTMAGTCHAARVGCSILHVAGCADLVATDADHYRDIAVHLAADAGRLMGMRRGMRQALAESPLMDAAAFTRNLEDSYRRMWTTWCRG
jgi:protein O-GlcNAc transferase